MQRSSVPLDVRADELVDQRDVPVDGGRAGARESDLDAVTEVDHGVGVAEPIADVGADAAQRVVAGGTRRRFVRMQRAPNHRADAVGADRDVAATRVPSASCTSTPSGPATGLELATRSSASATDRVEQRTVQRRTQQ